ncbi:hypothetical protein ACFVMC_33000 [Nocardia sp. NPDC127579]|uniref:hypothetical protein n=1 Tax=Nocardia sp. NPDC127579 TaxID=3345402 RepID=UPI00362B1B3F
MNPRDMVVLTILALMYGAPMDRVASMLGVSTKSAYRITAKWRAAHMISDLRIRPVLGPTWVFPTRSASEALMGISARYWTPTPKMAAHVTTVLDLRMALVGLDLDRWISERELRAQVGPVKAGQLRPHIHDGRFYDDQGKLWAVEAELTPKNDAQAKIAVAKAKTAAAQADCAGLIYYCKGAAVRSVITAAAQACAGIEGPAIRVADIEQVLTPRTEHRPGLRVIEGGASDHDGQDDGPGQPERVVRS